MENRYIVGGDIKKILVKNLDEAKKKLYDEYSANYKIVEKRHIPKSYFFGLFTRDMLEVSYIVKETDSFASQFSDYPKEVQKKLMEEKIQSLTKATQPINKTSNPQDANNFIKNKNDILLNSKLTDLMKNIEELKEQTQKTREIVSASPKADTNPTIKRIEELLSENEFTFNYINEIVEKIKKTFSLSQLDNFDKVQKQVIEWIGESIKVYDKKVFRPPHIVIIIGPTGVGKTTTLVKMAVRENGEAKKMGRSIESCFITTDIMRVGATEQLEKFGRIMEKKVIKAQTNEDAELLLNEYKSTMDVIFIDTAGYGPNDAEHIAGMKRLLQVKGIVPDIYLAVTASTKASDLHNIMQNYELFGYNSVIVTKCDESGQYGNIISVLHERNKAISYITDGQKVIGNLSRASIPLILENLTGFDIDKDYISYTFGDKNANEEKNNTDNNSNDTNNGTLTTGE